MQTLLVVLLSLLALLSGAALHYFFSLRRALKSVRYEMRELRQLQSAPYNDAVFDEPIIRMLVEVKDPIRLAHRKSPLAKIASPTAPNLVAKKVYEQVMQETREQLKGREVEANVSLIVL